MNYQDYIIQQKGSLEHFAETFHCEKCDAKFKARKDAVKTKEIPLENGVCAPRSGGCFLFACCSSGYQVKSWIPCPTPKCDGQIQMRATISDGGSEGVTCCKW
jgi:hypothetical protein